MIGMDIRGDISQVKASLASLGHDGIWIKTVTRSLLSSLANAGKKWIKGRMYANLHKMTGALGKSLRTTVKGNYATIAGNPARIGEPLERGAVITAKKGKYLTFRGSDGSWKKMHSVTIPARHWFSRSADGFEGSPEFGQAVDKAIARMIKKAELSQ